TSPSAPERKTALTTPPRAVATRRPPAGLRLVAIDRDASALKRRFVGSRRRRRAHESASQDTVPLPVLFASYSRLLGGAERVPRDCATRYPGPVLIACPGGPLAAAVSAAGLPHAPIASGPRRLRGGVANGASHAAGLARAGWELAGLIHRTRPQAL